MAADGSLRTRIYGVADGERRSRCPAHGYALLPASPWRCICSPGRWRTAALPVCHRLQWRRHHRRSARFPPCRRVPRKCPSRVADTAGSARRARCRHRWTYAAPAAQQVRPVARARSPAAACSARQRRCPASPPLWRAPCSLPALTLHSCRERRSAARPHSFFPLSPLGSAPPVSRYERESLSALRVTVRMSSLALRSDRP